MSTVEFTTVIGSGLPPSDHFVPGDRTLRGFDPGAPASQAKEVEAAGFDRALLVYESSWPDVWQVAAQVLGATERLKALVAHRPGFVAPTLAARTLASLDQYSGGRASVHIINGSSDAGQQRDGDWLPKTERYRRADEYLTVLKKQLTAVEPFDHEGDFYRVRDAFSLVRPLQQPWPTIFSGGSSQEAVDLAGRHSDVWMTWGEPLAATAEMFDRIRAAAAREKRALRGFSVGFRPILGATEEEAWERALAIRDKAEADTLARATRARPAQNEGSRRVQRAAENSDRHDRALYLGIAAATGSPVNHSALVGTPETVAEALADYAELGATDFLLMSYDTPVAEIGRTLIPLVRERIAARRTVSA